MSQRPAALALVLALLTAGCALQPVLQAARAPVDPAPPRDDLFVVVPDEDGKVGAITVVHGGDRLVLDRAYASARIAHPGRLETGASSPEDVDRVFGATVASLPLAPVSMTLYFTFGTDELTAESRQSLARVAAEISRRPAAEVVVVGHTDRVGTVQQNDALSLQRAERVRREVVEQLGIPADRIVTAGRGERDPLVATDDEVAEPRNRRVEITIR